MTEEAAAPEITITIDNLPPGIARVTSVDLSGSSPALELQVNIEGQVHSAVLPVDAWTLIELSGPEVAAELRAVRRKLEDVGPSPLAVALEVVQMLDGQYDLPKKETE